MSLRIFVATVEIFSPCSVSLINIFMSSRGSDDPHFLFYSIHSLPVKTPAPFTVSIKKARRNNPSSVRVTTGR